MCAWVHTYMWVGGYLGTILGYATWVRSFFYDPSTILLRSFSWEFATSTSTNRNTLQEMASSIRILSSTDVDKLLSQLDIVKLIDVHTATLFRTLAQANVIPDGSNIPDPESFVHSPHRLAVRAGSTSTNADGGGGGDAGGGGCGGRAKGGGGLYTTLVMPSSVTNYGTTIKLISVPNLAPRPSPSPSPSPTPPAPAPASTHTHTNTSRGFPATTVVVDERTGAVKAVVNARALNIRTALGE